MDNEVKFRDYPVFGWLFGLSMIGGGAYYMLTTFPSLPAWLVGVLVALLGFLLVILNYGLTITADKQTRILTLDYRSLLFHSVKEIPFDDIATIRIDSRMSRSSKGGRSTTYCITADMKDGGAIPFRAYYSSDFIFKQRIVDGLRKFMDLPEAIDATPLGIFRAAPRLGEIISQAQQKKFGESNVEMRVTSGVNWKVYPSSVGAMPATRWFSPDFKTREGFLYLAQKVAGQSSSGFMATLSTTLFKQSIALYGFTESDIPNLAQAQIYTGLSPALDTHFMAFTSDELEARQILNPWAQNPLAAWGTRHPLKQFQALKGLTQVSVLFSPNGVYVVTPAALNPDEVEELSTLGVELVKSQGA